MRKSNIITLIIATIVLLAWFIIALPAIERWNEYETALMYGLENGYHVGCHKATCVND